MENSWKIQNLIYGKFNFISSKCFDKNCVMNSKSDNIKIMSRGKTNEFIGDFFESILSRYQVGLETSMTCCDFIFDYPLDHI